VTESKIEAAKSRADADKALLGRAEDQLKRFESVTTGAVSITDLIEARFAVDRLRALADEAASRVGELEGELNKIELEVPMMEARIKLAESKLEEAQLALSRTKIPSPIDGRVLRLLAAPGQKRMLAMDAPDSATVAILYQPEKLQVRVDVPLADAAGLSVGQKARIRCNLLPAAIFEGEVTRIAGEADIQRNTLQAKVRLADPSPQLRPDMLCRVEFLATPGGAPGPVARGGRGGTLKLFVPENALTDGDSAVWVCDPESKRVKRQPVTAGSLRRDGHRNVNDGLRPGEWVVIDPSDLSDGQRVNPKLLESL
jgi:RND family efflux transporter MFP subunit